MSLSKQDKQDLVSLMADMLEEVVLPQIQLNRVAIERLDHRVDSLETQMIDLTRVVQAVRKDQLAHQLKLDHHDKQILKLEHAIAIR